MKIEHSQYDARQNCLRDSAWPDLYRISCAILHLEHRCQCSSARWRSRWSKLSNCYQLANPYVFFTAIMLAPACNCTPWRASIFIKIRQTEMKRPLAIIVLAHLLLSGCVVVPEIPVTGAIVTDGGPYHCPPGQAKKGRC